MATSTSSSSASIPPALAFLVSNFHSLVNLKLDSGNYLLWKTQVLNAFRANGYIGFLDGSSACPASTILDSENHKIVNPEFTLWTLIDNQLLSCLTSSLSSTTLPHVLGLVHVSQVWYCLEHRFNSLTRSHIHELKGRLYNVKKAGSMDSYIDEIRGHAQRLEAVGHHVEDDDLVFHAINGLPQEKFKPLKTALLTRGTDVSFEELATILKSEEMQAHKSDFNSAKVFVATSQNSSGSATTVSPQFSENSGVRNTGQLFQPQAHTHTQMFQPNGQGNFYPQTYPNPNRNNKAKGVNFGNQKISCQICGKTNHTAFYCYQRQNMQYQPPPFVNIGRSGSQSWFGTPQYPVNGNFSGQNGQQFMGFSGFSGPSMMGYGAYSGPAVPYSPSSSFSGPAMSYNGSKSQQFGPPIPYNTNTSQQYGQNFGNQYSMGGFSSPFVPPVANMVNNQIGLPIQSSMSTNTPSSAPNWYFDSGASTHVTNDLASLQIHQPCLSGEGVVVGNGTTIPVTHSGTGQSNTSSPSQGAMSSGFIPNSDIL